ncbi:MAG: hypothetical protein MJ240_07600 [Kiritimatiellae bacterium]|nr:hypothetical protein [Kiritimatiellia bacterium]
MDMLSKKGAWLALVVALCGVVSADTWYVMSGTSSGDVQTINDLSKWTNSVGTVGSGAPTLADDQVIPRGITYRVGNLTSQSKSVTLYGSITHDGAGTITWANDGLFIAAGAKYSLNTYIKPHAFDDMRTINLNGTFTILGESPSSPVLFQHQQEPYSNHIYRVQKLVGAVGTYVRVNNAAAPRNVTVEFADAAEFKGNLEGVYSSDSIATSSQPLDNGEYGERVVFSGLDTPGKLTIGKNFVLGARPDVVTKAAEVELRDGARVEAAISRTGVSRLDVGTRLTFGENVQILVVGDSVPLPVGRYPVITAPTAIDLEKFVLKKAPNQSGLQVELETEFADDVGILYLKVNGYSNYYVDAVNGDDAWDGCTNTIPSAEAIALGGEIHGPKKTLAAAMEIAGPYTTVYAAEGVYDEGEMHFDASSVSNRVVVPQYVTLQATGRQECTVIKGKVSTEPGNVSGNFTDAVRCVCLRTGAVVKGFTLLDGRTNGSGAEWDICGGAVCSYKSSAEEQGMLVDCVITNCGSANRGPNVYGHVTLLRCRIMQPACGSYDFYKGACVVDSIIQETSTAYDSCQFVNCTFPMDTSIWGNPGISRAHLRNCLHTYVSASSRLGRNMTVTNSFFCSPRASDTTSDFNTDDRSRYSLADGEILCSPTSYRPSVASVVVGQGDLEMYLAVTNDWPVTMRRQFTMKDIYGTDRLYGGALDLGAVQHQGQLNRYVDANQGNDAQDGLTAATAKRTLKAVMNELETANDYYDMVVHAAPGVYDEGEMFYANCSNRVVVPKYVGLVADQGPKVTTIRGKFGDIANTSKAGAAAVRCVYLNTGAWVQGFTITGGSTQKNSSSDSGLGGGGVYSSGGATVACIITGNAGGSDTTYFRGPGGVGGTYIGCHVYGNDGQFQLYHADGATAVGERVVNSVLDGSNGYYGNADLLNCTIYSGGDSMSWSYCATHAWNCYVATNPGRARGYVNCFFSAKTFRYINESTTQQRTNDFDPETCRFEVANNVDAEYLPLADSLFVDAGSRALYDANFPAKWIRFKDVGFLGQQRVYNGAIDVGAGEYDVRNDMAQKLNGARKVSVDVASADATVASDGVTLNAGDAIEMMFDFKAKGPATFTVTGNVTVTVDGAVLEPQNGVYVVNGTKDSNRIVKVVNGGTTSAKLGVCVLPFSGTMIQFR